MDDVLSPVIEPPKYARTADSIYDKQPPAGQDHPDAAPLPTPVALPRVGPTNTPDKSDVASQATPSQKSASETVGVRTNPRDDVNAIAARKELGDYASSHGYGNLFPGSYNRGPNKAPTSMPAVHGSDQGTPASKVGTVNPHEEHDHLGKTVVDHSQAKPRTSAQQGAYVEPTSPKNPPAGKVMAAQRAIEAYHDSSGKMPYERQPPDVKKKMEQERIDRNKVSPEGKAEINRAMEGYKREKMISEARQHYQSRRDQEPPDIPGGILTDRDRSPRRRRVDLTKSYGPMNRGVP